MVSLETILRDKLIPWSGNAAHHIIVGKPHMRASMLPDGVRLEKRPLRGKRTIIKKERLYRNSRILRALWPEQGLNETNLFKMACVLSGYVDFQLGEQAVLCGPGYFIFIPPNLPHPDGSRNISDISKNNFCEIIYFRLNHSALQCWISRYEPNSSMPRAQGNYLLTHEHVTHLFQICMEEAIAGAPARMELSAKLLQSFLCVIQREIQAGHLQEVPHGEDDESPQHHFRDTESFSEHLHQYIQSHLYNRPTLENAAQYMYLSRAQFARRVRAETGKTFVELLNEHRIETAKELLRDSEWTISSIATFIGYRSPHHFQSLFRQHTGMTPNTYRRQTRKN